MSPATGIGGKGFVITFGCVLCSFAAGGCGKSEPGPATSSGSVTTSDDYKVGNDAVTQFLANLTAKKATLAEFTPAFKKAIAPPIGDVPDGPAYNEVDSERWLKAQQEDAPAFEIRTTIYEGIGDGKTSTTTFGIDGFVKGKTPPEYFALRMRKAAANDWQVEWFQRTKKQPTAYPKEAKHGRKVLTNDIAQSFLNALVGGDDILAEAAMSMKLKQTIAPKLPPEAASYNRTLLKERLSAWREGYPDYKLTSWVENSFEGELTREGKSRRFWLTVGKDPAGEWQVTKFKID